MYLPWIHARTSPGLWGTKWTEYPWLAKMCQKHLIHTKTKTKTKFLSTGI